MAYRPSAGRNRRLAGGPKEPDIVPLMNLFLTIIPFMLYMLVIVQLALVALNFTPSGGGGGGGAQGPGGDGAEEKKLEIYIMDQDAPDRGLFPGFKIKEPGQEDRTIVAVDTLRIPDASGELVTRYVYNFQALNEALKQIRERNPKQTQISVSPYPSILYGPLIKTIDLCKHNKFTNVMYKPATIDYF